MLCHETTNHFCPYKEFPFLGDYCFPFDLQNQLRLPLLRCHPSIQALLLKVKSTQRPARGNISLQWISIFRSSEGAFTNSRHSNRPDNNGNSGMLNRYLYQTGGVEERLLQGKVMTRREHVDRATKAIVEVASVCEKGK